MQPFVLRRHACCILGQSCEYEWHTEGTRLWRHACIYAFGCPCIRCIMHDMLVSHAIIAILCRWLGRPTKTLPPFCGIKAVTLSWPTCTFWDAQPQCELLSPTVFFFQCRPQSHPLRPTANSDTSKRLNFYRYKSKCLNVCLFLTWLMSTHDNIVLYVGCGDRGWHLYCSSTLARWYSVQTGFKRYLHRSSPPKTDDQQYQVLQNASVAY